MTAKERSKRYDDKPSSKASAAIRRRDYYEKHIDRHILARTKARAKVLGLPFNLVKEDIVVPERCPVLDIPIVIHFGRGNGPKINSPSIDRMKPEQGYVQGNIRIISQRANLLKSDATVEELERVLADLRKIKQ